MALSQQETILFNKYELGKLLGHGAFAKVYHARDIATGQSVAIKVINKNKLSHLPSVKHEISIMSKLNHPNIVELYEVLATKTKIHFVLEFAKGGELFAKLGKVRFDEELCRKVFRQLISAVSHCHSKGIFHRDLKPENLLLDEYGNLKVSDFGLSALSGQVWSDGLLHTVCGTPAYVAPEILLKRGYDGAKVDIWSCGVVLFVLAVGHLPFNDSNLMSMYRKICKGKYTSPKWISTDLNQFLSRLMDPNPNTRITMDEIKRDRWLSYEETQFRGNECLFKNEGKGTRDLNAFDIISFSSGLDLSGLFGNGCRLLEDVERVVIKDSREKVLAKLMKLGNKDILFKAKSDCGLEIAGRNGVMVDIEVQQLSDELVMVEASRKGGDGNSFVEIWKDKLRPMILNRSDQQASSC